MCLLAVSEPQTLHESMIEIINNKARHNLIDAKYRWRSNRLVGAVSFWELLGQSKLMRIHQRETQNHQGAITHEVCFLVAQFHQNFYFLFTYVLWFTGGFTFSMNLKNHSGSFLFYIVQILWGVFVFNLFQLQQNI